MVTERHQSISKVARMNAAVEKRHFNRVGFQKPIRVFPVLPSKSGNIYEVQNESFEVHAYDVSEGGVGFETNRPMSPDFLVKMNFELSQDQPVEVYGKIVWAQSNRCGVRFMHMDYSLRKMVRSLS